MLFLNFIISTLLSLGVMAAPVAKPNFNSGEKFGVLTVRSGDANVHQRNFFVGDSGKIFLGPYDGAKEASTFFIKDKKLYFDNQVASRDDKGTVVFTNDTNKAAEGFTAEVPTSLGYYLQFDGKSPYACPYETAYEIVYADKADNGCVGVNAIALKPFTPANSTNTSTSIVNPTSTVAPTATISDDVSSVVGVRDITSTTLDQSVIVTSIPTPTSGRLLPNKIRVYKSSTPNKQGESCYSPEVSLIGDEHVNTIFTFNVGKVSGKCYVSFHLDTRARNLAISGDNGVGNFMLYNLNGNPTDGTTYANTPARLRQVSRVDCNSEGCDSLVPVTCPSSNSVVSYEMTAYVRNSHLSFFESVLPTEGLSLFI
ncbi:But2 family protein [Schizosaccharomyces japonicus yFS275]|uniref:But2 family protein n=1 Tax=Schizosaccharomyces japonicus (strain yFS275 / FY16936) TaxID=402676 RepID=B6JXH1_SCHJY|nr:But2 family protein [Schizosaccharomyces japonicus yFS275]EEB05115.1 But2 family protein [Schizosaccharomyces japonicus yFS275]